MEIIPKERYVVMKENNIGLVNRRKVHARDRPEDASHTFIGLPLPPKPIEDIGFPIPEEDPNYPKALGDPDFPQIVFHTTLGDITFEVGHHSSNQYQS